MTQPTPVHHHRGPAGRDPGVDTAYTGMRTRIDAETAALLAALHEHSQYLAWLIVEATRAVALGAGAADVHIHGAPGSREPYEAADDGTVADAEVRHLRRLRKRHAARLRRALHRLRVELELDPPERGPRDAAGRLRILVSDDPEGSAEGSP